MLKHVKQKQVTNPNDQQHGLMALKESLNRPKGEKIQVKPGYFNDTVKEKMSLNEKRKSNPQFGLIDKEKISSTEKRKSMPQVGLMALKNALNKQSNNDHFKDALNKQTNNDHLKDALKKQTNNDHLKDALNKQTKHEHLRDAPNKQTNSERIKNVLKKQTNFDQTSFDSDTDSGIVSARSSIIYKEEKHDNYETEDTKVAPKGITGMVGAINQLQNDLLNMALYLDQDKPQKCDCDKPKKSLIKEETSSESSNFVTEKYLELSSYEDELEGFLPGDDEKSDPEDFLSENAKPVEEWSLGNIGLQKLPTQYGSPTGAKGTMFNMSFVTKGRKFSGDKK